MRVSFKPQGVFLDILRRERLLSLLGSPCSLERAQLGQIITLQQMENLQQALERMHRTCEYVQWKAEESDEDETDDQDDESSEGAAELERQMMEFPGQTRMRQMIRMTKVVKELPSW